MKYTPHTLDKQHFEKPKPPGKVTRQVTTYEQQIMHSAVMRFFFLEVAMALAMAIATRGSRCVTDERPGTFSTGPFTINRKRHLYLKPEQCRYPLAD